MKDFRIIIWKKKSMNSQRQIEMEQVVDKVFKIKDSLYDLFNGLNETDYDLPMDDIGYDEMWNLMKRMAQLVINKYFHFDEDEYYFQELGIENNEVYCEIHLN